MMIKTWNFHQKSIIEYKLDNIFKIGHFIYVQNFENIVNIICFDIFYFLNLNVWFSDMKIG